ncbi:probable U3 small nucleolar RNA-associated protein 11 [Cucurbita moschata]|uniref:U3 small nucleolar RNA-associated protein 11 n=1 Tax=Cucurbita moschata TaxID=3662 RepID=A0A6J1EWL8_CUCMO|nr:probable U3 small nucleolar RNA-associated protein 11 [Cucurbita moschata]XP_022932536.1 probable U3 small nucleolar RNA-associated protein 11 [Cucurbita moschata]
MRSLKNAIRSRLYRKRARPHSRRHFGLFEKHRDYVKRAKAYHKKEATLEKLEEKSAFRNRDEFYFKMIKARTVHKPERRVNKYTKEQLILMKTQDAEYILQKMQSEERKIEKLTATLHSFDNQPSNEHLYFAEDREETNEIQCRSSKGRWTALSETVPNSIKRKTAASYKELEARRSRVWELEKLYRDMRFQQELRKMGRKRKRQEDELSNPTSNPVYKWRAERKR